MWPGRGVVSHNIDRYINGIALQSIDSDSLTTYLLSTKKKKHSNDGTLGV